MCLGCVSGKYYLVDCGFANRRNFLAIHYEVLGIIYKNFVGKEVI